MSFDSFYKGFAFTAADVSNAPGLVHPPSSGSRILIDDQSGISSLHTSREGKKKIHHCNVLSSQYAPASTPAAAVFTVFLVLIPLEGVCVGCILFFPTTA